jgi:hypothetical protein
MLRDAKAGKIDSKGRPRLMGGSIETLPLDMSFSPNEANRRGVNGFFKAAKYIVINSTPIITDG